MLNIKSVQPLSLASDLEHFKFNTPIACSTTHRLWYLRNSKAIFASDTTLACADSVFEATLLKLLVTVHANCGDQAKQKRTINSIIGACMGSGDGSFQMFISNT